MTHPLKQILNKDRLKIIPGAKTQFTNRFAMPKRFNLRDDYRFWPDEINAFVNLSMSREVPIATTRKQGFSPSIDAAELLALLMYDIQVFSVAIEGIGEPINEAEKADANYLAFRGYFRCVYAAWLSAELKATLSFRPHFGGEQTITATLNSINDDFTLPGLLGHVEANHRRITMGGASRVFCESGKVFENYLINHGYKDLPPIHMVATDIYNTLNGLSLHMFEKLILISSINKKTKDGFHDDEEKRFVPLLIDTFFADAQGAFFVLKTALSFLTKGIIGIKTITAPSCLKMPAQKTLCKKDMDSLKDEITSSFIDLSFVQTANVLQSKALDIFNPGTFTPETFGISASRFTDLVKDYGIRYNFDGVRNGKQ